MTTPSPPVPVRISTPADLDAIVATLTTAFFDDPLWGPAYPDVERRAAQAAAVWRLLATSSQRYPWTLVTANVESAAVWIPPGGTELSDDELKGFEEFLVEIADRAVADGILEMFDHLDRARPAAPHFYLSLLATHSEHRGAGLGMHLLEESLARIDALGQAAYLESSNPVNNPRYEHRGFRPQTDITMPSGIVVTTMWRPARSDRPI
jgi:GNAT superfamily N-acetyltransferase